MGLCVLYVGDHPEVSDPRVHLDCGSRVSLQAEMFVPRYRTKHRLPRKQFPPAADVAVVGGGLVGLCCASAIAERGADVVLLSAQNPGEASPAAAGMLAPNVEHAGGAAYDFAIAARERYVSFVASLEEVTGCEVPLDRNGVLELALDDERAEALRRGPYSGRWLTGPELREMEPLTAPAAGALYHPLDGCVDNVALFYALREKLSGESHVQILDEAPVFNVETDDSGAIIRTALATSIRASQVVIAAGAWIERIGGMSIRVPVTPVRGQMLAVQGSPVRHVTFGPHGYLVPRSSGVTLAGSTVENAGFNPSITAEGRQLIIRGALEICPTFDSCPVIFHWAGLRPMTPDGLPIIDRDPTCPCLVYACGHSRNGILLAPLTGDCVAALLGHEKPPFDIAPFSLSRFPSRQ